MNRLTRRRLLAGSAASLTALAGCSSLPIGGERDPELGFDPATLSRSVVQDMPDPPETYSAPVPETLATHHRRRARELLNGVPREPGFANEGLSTDLSEMRTDTLSEIENGPDELGPLQRLDEWRSIRSDAAEVRAAYDAATGTLGTATLTRRHDRLRQDLRAFESAWQSPGRNALDALATAYLLEDMRTDCWHSVDLGEPVPSNPRTNPLVTGRLAGGLEEGRALLDDLTELREAHREAASTLTSYQDTLSVMADQFRYLIPVTRRQVDLYLGDGARADDFERKIDDLPAEQVFYDVQAWTQRRIREAREERTRRNYARAIVRGGHALVMILALSQVVDAIQAGKYGMPATIEEVREYRDQAIAAVEEAQSIEPTRLAALLSLPAWNRLRWEVRDFQAPKRRDPPNEREVVRLVAAFVGSYHFANAVKPVVNRLQDDLLDGTSVME